MSFGQVLTVLGFQKCQMRFNVHTNKFLESPKHRPWYSNFELWRSFSSTQAYHCTCFASLSSTNTKPCLNQDLQSPQGPQMPLHPLKSLKRSLRMHTGSCPIHSRQAHVSIKIDASVRGKLCTLASSANRGFTTCVPRWLVTART